ncbi:hypothetical protein Acr_25g0003460 [Actinidia rufa]|uniref:Tetratricopeptide repeat protein 5 OB fold domain-containing protein n=1 Tax=Actinidia rufa TaxID=165716 RepID=A0A7J0GYM4_9ERIC|nr:hypothetical protein Acr_25g0003460 [Actinidia rufa]
MSAMSNQSRGEDAEDKMAKAMKAADDLYNIRDTYFPANLDEKISRLQAQSDLALKLLDSIPSEQRKLPMQRATYEYLRGKILDVFPDYRKEAEDHLSKAVKLSPSLADAWLCLGNSIWKKGDLPSAKNCFTLALNKGPNKKILCQLSMLERRMAQGADNQAEMVEESINHAKEAIMLDVKDGNSWWPWVMAAIWGLVGQWIFGGCVDGHGYGWLALGNGDLEIQNKDGVGVQTGNNWLAAWEMGNWFARVRRADGEQLDGLGAFLGGNMGGFRALGCLKTPCSHYVCAIMLKSSFIPSATFVWADNLGNACLTCFFVTGAWDHHKLVQSLKAYQNAEKDESMNSNPDLYFNCATVNKYLENYERALSGFEAAASRDPGLNSTEEVRKIVNLLDKLETLLRGQTKAKRLNSLASSLSAVNLNPSYRKANIDCLSEGLNKKVAIVGKVLFFVKHENVAPLYYLVCDSNQICFVLSVYGIRDDAFKEGDQLTLLEPNYRDVDFSWKGKLYQFKSVRVDFLEQVLVNGKALSSLQAVRTSIHAQHKA